MAPVVRELQSMPDQFDTQICVTAQHRQMLDQVLAIFDIRPHIDLNIMTHNQSLAGLTASIFSRLDTVVSNVKPDWILAQGDTTTVMVASVLAYYHHVNFGHVEAGLRTGDKWQPFPEEINRRIAGITADLHFAPTEWSKMNLLNENIPVEKILVTGNPVIDALQWVAKQPYPNSDLEKLGVPIDVIEEKKRIVLITAHRRENFGEPLERICTSILNLAVAYRDDVHFIYPVHLNPNVQGPVHRSLGNVKNITLLPPLDYLPLVQLLKRATLVLTDSGGLQEEAPGLGVPVLVLREVTERPEGIQAGTVKLVGTDPKRIVSTSHMLLDNPQEHQKMSKAANPYGDGHAAERIVQALNEAN